MFIYLPNSSFNFGYTDLNYPHGKKNHSQRYQTTEHSLNAGRSREIVRLSVQPLNSNLLSILNLINTFGNV